MSVLKQNDDKMAHSLNSRLYQVFSWVFNFDETAARDRVTELQMILEKNNGKRKRKHRSRTQ